MSPTVLPTPKRRGGLFGRILATFLATAVASAVVAAVAGYMVAARYSAEWVAQVVEAIDAHAERFAAAGTDEAALDALTSEIGQQLDARVGFYTRRGHKLAGDGPPRLPHHIRERRDELRQGSPVTVHRERFEPPAVIYGLTDPSTGKIAGMVGVLPPPRSLLAVALLAVGVMVVVLGAGAWVLSRSLTRRLARIETGADRIAHGELRHRITLDAAVPRDELDQLAGAFNEMAEKVEALLHGQRTLLANVSHELRTPIARMKVLVEILQERVVTLRERGDESRPVLRLDQGLRDIGLDIGEVEALISDLLTSGRLELRQGAGATEQVRPFAVGPLLVRVAAKVGAQVELARELELELEADELLVERLVSNLLANARRACPHGRITVSARTRGDMVELAVEDEGPGVAPEHRETIFEPFTRLDEARDRDRGGVGLGLYLCRQICRSHQGTIEATDRLDGAPGARFVVRLPLRQVAAA
jgi:signal transduction histidine kinase